MGFQLREALRQLCVEIGWSYAVFWRSIRGRDQMHLIWGDGHCERAGISGFEAMDLLLKERVALRSSQGDPFAEIEGETEDRVSSLVYKMMANQVNVVGDGIVGQVALTGKHQWILRDSLIDYGSVPKGLVEMNHQFLAGIKTIAVVPVLPHGVVQLGSTQMVMENTGLINHIRNLFTQLECIPGALASNIFTQNIHGLPNFLDQAGDSGTSVRRVSNLDGNGYNHHPLDDVLDRRRSIVQPSSFTQVSGKPPANASGVPHDISFEGQQAQHHQTQILTSSSSLSSNVLFSKELLSISEQSNSIQMISKSVQPRCLTTIQNSRTSPSEGHQTIDTESVEFNKHHSSIGSQLGTQDIWLSNWSPIHGKDKTESAVFVKDDNIMKNDKSLQEPNKRTTLGHVCPNSGNDLFDLLGLNNKSAAFHGSMDDVVLHSNDSNALNDEFYCSGLFSQASPDQLLDAVVSYISSDPKQILDVSASIKTSETDISSSSGLPKQEVAGPASLICSMDKTGGSLHNDGSYKSQIDLWVNKGKDVITDNNSAAHCKWIDEVGKMNKKRPRPGENPRPRPKDRQMIQDRVKELREIVPNGAKCSIDALLEKTIKHMLFLQGVTKHADKLKEIGEPKIMSKEGGLLLKDNTSEGSSTWAFEVGSRSMICPIIVEDLNSPRQMLVEMLCEQSGLFLEIADLIRGMGLTILKGVIEARDGKVWARFAVEANRDITRMEIFLSLVQLLEPNAGSNSMALHCAESSRACTIV